MADFECTNKAMALTALDTIAASMKGTQREAVLAVKAWVQENVPNPLSAETIQKLKDVFEYETEGERLGREWYNRGSQKLETGEWVNSEPADGAEWKCVWNAKNKCWKPPFPPPLIQGREPDKSPSRAQ
jgi:hypothetical protein